MKRILLGLLGLVLLILSTENTMLLIFPMWIFTTLFKDPLQKVMSKAPHDLGFLTAGLIFGMLTESFAILNNLDLPPNERILLHPEPLPDLLYGFFYYSFLILTWYLLLRKINFSQKDIFLLTAIFGIFTEETGAVFIRIFTEPLTGPLYAIIVAFVYGIFPVLAYLLTEENFSTERVKPKLKHYLLAGFGLFLQYALYGNFVYQPLENIF